jgi:hypothetical protein
VPPGRPDPRDPPSRPARAAPLLSLEPPAEAGGVVCGTWNAIMEILSRGLGSSNLRVAPEVKRHAEAARRLGNPG